jgi:hypothetical protein
MSQPSSAKGTTSDSRRPVTGAPSFELLFKPSIELISVVRRFVAEFYSRVLQDEDTASRLELTTHELLENAAKYSCDGSATLYVELDQDRKTVCVRTTNRATPEQIASLQHWFSEITAAPNADELYAEMIRRTAVKQSGSGGIGLARIGAESEMKMQLSVDGDRVVVEARGHITQTA